MTILYCKTTILVKTFSRLFQVRKMQFKLTPSPLDSVGWHESVTFSISCTREGGGGWLGLKKNFLNAVFMGVYSRLAKNYIQKRLKKWRRPKTQEPNEQIIVAVPFFREKIKILLVIMNYAKIVLA